MLPSCKDPLQETFCLHTECPQGRKCRNPTLLCHRKAQNSTNPNCLIKDAKSLDAVPSRSQKLSGLPYGLASQRGCRGRCVGSQLLVTEQILFLQANNVKRAVFRVGGLI